MKSPPIFSVILEDIEEMFLSYESRTKTLYRQRVKDVFLPKSLTK